MTFREKFHKEFPKEKELNPALKWCPSSLGYEEDYPPNLKPCDRDCDECWDREIPERKVFYLCDGRVEKCMHRNGCYKNCREGEKAIYSHTTDIEHAVNFTRIMKGSKDFIERKQTDECGNNMHFNIDIEPFIGISDQAKKVISDLNNGIQDARNKIRELNDRKACLYLGRLSELQTLNEDGAEDVEPVKNQSEVQGEELIELRSKGLSKEERTILMDAMERGLRRIRHYREKDDLQDVPYLEGLN